MTDKLAEEIIKQFVVEIEGLGSIEYVSHELAIHCMQAYHEAKLRESKIIESFERENQYVTDYDIEVWANTQCLIEPMMGYSRASMIAAAKAMRDGEIKHIEK